MQSIFFHTVRAEDIEIFLSSEIQMIRKKIQDEQVSKCIVFCAWVHFL